MKKLLLPLIGLVALLAGAGGGYFLRPHSAAEAEPPPEETVVPPDYVKLNNQFVVPVLEKGRVVSMVILSLSLEVVPGTSERVYEIEPKLRDAFLQVLFDHSNAGGFRGSFTDGANLVLLRKALLEAAQAILTDKVSDVLIVEIVRQDS
ncbi:flagellar basal body-associated protein FliL [Gemmobacter aquarius]|uniref:Flagellar protein FliL n=1 Tax=Paragemmobacter aquarius TaxID=2169400 RepID=A0A2S0UQQ0_9RHOB|nr:flagellar basal body-associated FliL family protein [Gemmobacter aquarius]AWB50112.1 flagellar basal body-associated protein FliL [Gemmobacter aquarius]